VDRHRHGPRPGPGNRLGPAAPPGGGRGPPAFGVGAVAAAAVMSWWRARPGAFPEGERTGVARDAARSCAEARSV
jgi:hypothetical protein